MYLGVLYVVAVLAFVVSTAWSLFRQKKGFGKVLATNLVLIFGLVITMRFAAPWMFHEVVYMGLILNLGLSVPLLIGCGILFPALKFLADDRKALAGTYAVLGVTVAAGGIWFLGTQQSLRTALSYRPQQRQAMLEVDPTGTYFTPKGIANNKMRNHVSMASFTALDEDTDAVDVASGIGYRTPLTPSGMVQHFTAQNYGFVTYDDRPGIRQEERVVVEEQRYTYGEEMYVFDNIYRLLYSEDPFCYYPDIYYLTLVGQEQQGYVAVAPQIKHRLEFPGVFVRYWSGVTLVFANGTLEHLSVDAAKSDSRLKGKILFPSDLTRLIVEAQRFDQGWLSGLIRRDDKIEVPNLPAGRQWPLRVKGKDGSFYDVIATEPDGENHSLYKLFFVNKNTGEFSYFQYGDESGRGGALIGPVRAAELVKSLGYVWFEEHGQSSSGTHRIVEPRFVAHEGSPYWVFSITTRQMADVVSTVVVNAASERVVELKTRSEFDAWVSGAAIETVPSTPGTTPSNEELKEIRKDLEHVLERLRRLEQAPK